MEREKREERMTSEQKGETQTDRDREHLISRIMTDYLFSFFRLPCSAAHKHATKQFWKNIQSFWVWPLLDPHR